MTVSLSAARRAAPLLLSAPLALLGASAAGPHCESPEAPESTESTGESPEARETRAVAEPYVEAALGTRDLERAAELLADDVFFIDPTTEVWGSALAQGVRGRDAVLAAERGFGVQTVEFDVQESFVSGRHAVFAGLLSWTSDGQPPAVDVPFVTALRVEEGRVTERRDWGDYDRIAGLGGLDGTERTGEIARAYVAAWDALDVEALDRLWSDDVVLVDATAPGTEAGESIEGRDALREHVAGGWSAWVREVDVEPELEIVSGHHAVFVAQVHFTLSEAFPFPRHEGERVHAGPLVVALTIADGRVLRHRQYFDYESWIERLSELMDPGRVEAGD